MASTVLVLIIILLIVANVYCIYFYNTKKPEEPVEDPVVELIRRIMISNYEYLTASEHKEIDDFSNDSETKINNKFPSINTNEGNLKTLCSFGTRVLKHYGVYSEKKYLNIVVKIIEIINKKVTVNTKFSETDPEYNDGILTKDLAPFLVMYQYIADHSNNVSTNAICYDFINKLIPELNKIKDKDPTKNTLKVYGNIPRLLTNYINNKIQYNADISNNQMDTFKQILNKIITSNNTIDKIDNYDFYYYLCSAFEFWNKKK
ncbi:uncharacterized protein LOC130673974 [Microplitis mediator]|uniref:uncharacterized protein LOC130673974 n=1 Tax=Microplitis mediator TaxID=375433 RepID=UPI002554FA17|nr:uncharacterized protein LOC130673974 [Microplitis mediator]